MKRVSKALYENVLETGIFTQHSALITQHSNSALLKIILLNNIEFATLYQF